VFKKQFGKLFALMTCMLLAGQAFTATERFDYDPLGRLIRVVDENNKATDYVYDAAGNLLEVRNDGLVAAPTVTDITPTSLRRGETKAVTITGTGFTGAAVSTPAGAGISIKNLQGTATQFSFDVTASETATTGAQAITIASSAGSATTHLTVAPLLPKVYVDPTPLAIPPDSALRQFTIRLSHVDTIDHVIALSASNTKIEVSPASLTIPAGQQNVSANIKGVSAGQVTLTLSSATLGTTSVPVFVTAEFKGITTSLAPYLGVVLESPPQQKTQQITPVTNPLVGVILGSAIRHTSPNRVNIGTEARLTIHGNGLSEVQSAAIEPSTGVTLGTPVAAADGFTVEVPITVASEAPVTQRRLILKNASGAVYPAAHPTADRIEIVRSAPQIDSIEPLFGTANTTIKMTIRGRDLHAAESILFNPSTGIMTDAMPVVSADGTVLTAKVHLGWNAASGQYTVAVATPGGLSSTAAASTNTFTIVNEIKQAITPILAPAVGVTVETPSTPKSSSYGLTSPVVNVIRGTTATALTPSVGIVGEETTLTIEGNELSGVTSIEFIPNAGLTVGTLTAATDGKSVTVPVTIAADAALTLRQVRLMAGTAEVPFATPEASRFKVSLPLPEIHSITPITLQIGQAPIALTIRGRNFKDASAVKVTPTDGMTIGIPPADGSSTEVTVNISAAATAATGPRLVTVVTPAGESSTTLASSNTITLANSAGSTYSPIVAPIVGVVKQFDSQPASTAVGPIATPVLGVVVESVPAPVSTTTTHYANKVGVALGSVALSLDAVGFAPGFNGALTISGHELDAVTSVSVKPAEGITFGTPTVSSDSAQVAVPMTVDATAARGVRTVTLGTAAGAVNFVDPAKATLQVGPGVPHIDSITPILAEQGNTVTMVIRGARFHDATAVTASPNSGINFVPGTLSVNAAGTELSVSFIIDAAAPVGSRVIQVLVPGAASNANATAANTFTVLSKPN
jgi:YD repeat-containing protein